MALLVASLEEEIFMKNNVRFRVIGDRSRLPQEVKDVVSGLEKRTENNNAMTAVIALSYSSRWELTKAMNDMAREVAEGKLKPGDITEETVSNHLESHFMPDPELLIRTGGELRISNYLLWQIAYSELYFCDTYWPDFDEEELHKAIADYQRRQRRFGKTEEQVENEQKTQS
jgi:undecaprenyl diphosphate synthase